METSLQRKLKVMERQVKNEELLFDLCRMEDSEEADLYLLDLYLGYQDDLSVFTADERKRISRIIRCLKKETEKHSDLLKEVIRELESDRQKVTRSN